MYIAASVSPCGNSSQNVSSTHENDRDRGFPHETPSLGGETITCSNMMSYTWVSGYYLPEYLPSDMWPPGSQDCNPWDYDVWSSLDHRVFRVVIRDLCHLH